MFFEDALAPVASKINKKLGIKSDVFSYKLYQVIRTYLLFSFAMIFFRAESVGNAITIIRYMFIWNPWVILDGETIYYTKLQMPDFRVLTISLVVLFVVDYLSRKGSVREKFFNQNIVFRWIIVYILIFSIIIFGCYRTWI